MKKSSTLWKGHWNSKKYCNMLTWNIWKKIVTLVKKKYFSRSQLKEPPCKVRRCVWYVIKHLQWKTGWKNLSRKSTLRSGKIIVTKYSEILVKWTITFINYVNQPVMNSAQKMRFKMTQKTILLRKQTWWQRKIWNIRHNKRKKKPENWDSTVWTIVLKRQWKPTLSSG